MPGASRVTPTFAWPPINANGVVYVNSGGRFFAIDGNTGAILKTLTGSYHTSPVVANGHVYLISADAISAFGVQE